MLLNNCSIIVGARLVNDGAKLVVVAFQLLQSLSHQGVGRNLVVGLFDPASTKTAYIDEILALGAQQQHPNEPCSFWKAHRQLGRLQSRPAIREAG